MVNLTAGFVDAAIWHQTFNRLQVVHWQAAQRAAQHFTFDGAGPVAVGIAVLLLLLVLVRSLLRLQQQVLQKHTKHRQEHETTYSIRG